MKLQQFVKKLPKHLVYAPIYRKGVEIKSKEGKILEATGKNPYGESYERNFSPDDVAYVLEKYPNRFGAIGLFTGLKGKGLVILDVDKNLAIHKKKWGDTLDGAPCITSTKKNAAKYIFNIPEELWSSVKGRFLSEQTSTCYEILWNRQGVIFGSYPGSASSPEGSYGFEGDLDNIPVAPDWLLAEMKSLKANEEKAGFVKNRSGLNLSDRTEDEKAQIIQECLSVIPTKGAGSREHWLHVGMAIHSEIPNDVGLELWSVWSKNDPDYINDWDKHNPCEAVWKSFKGSGRGIGSLIFDADEVDPKRLRFTPASLDIVQKAQNELMVRTRRVKMSFQDVKKEYMRICEDVADPGEQDFLMHQLAIDNEFKDLERLESCLMSSEAFDLGSEEMTASELDAEDLSRSYVIPEILPTPAVFLLYGAGGDGKSMAAWALAKHISLGIPFEVQNNVVPIQKGKVLILNADQPKVQLREQLREQDYKMDNNTVVINGFQIKREYYFAQLIKKHKPTLVIIDSLIGSSAGRAFDENKSSFASPLYRITNNNGHSFPATTILVIHHANKQGGFRGTSSIRDAVDETWKLSKPDKEMSEQLGSNTRIIRVEKSRFSRMGSCLLLKQLSDLSFELKDYKPKVENSSPASIIDRILEKLRTVYPETRSRIDLNADPLIGGNVTAIRKSLERLVDRGLIQVWEQKPSVNGGRPTNYYKAILVRGDKKSVALNGKPSDNSDLAMRQVDKKESCHIGTDKTMRQEKEKSKSRIDKPLPQQESITNATGDSYSHVRGNDKDAWKAWK
jgi:predicted transcriptional regulator